jgi:predicted GNAT superfamily acetyltransferase
MMSDLIRNVESSDIQELIRINDLAVPAVNSISSNKFEWFLENSLYFKLIESSSKEVKGFLLVLPEDLEYESLNYKWFNKRYKKFAYIDRIAILNKFKRKGFWKIFYSDLENTIKSNYSMIACEYNLKANEY